MTLSELEHQEQLALVGLTRTMIQLDGKFSRDEHQLLDDIIDELGEERFETLLAEASEAMQDEEAVRYQARHVKRQEACELIYAVLFNLAIPDSIVQAESDLLAWLKETWQLTDVGE